jgi:hypothetical protein
MAYPDDAATLLLEGQVAGLSWTACVSAGVSSSLDVFKPHSTARDRCQFS